MAAKFIIYEDRLIMSFNIDFHFQLIPKDGDKKNVHGGGHMCENERNKFLLFYSSSTDFGPATKEAVTEAAKVSWFSHHFDGWPLFFSQCSSLGDALLNNEQIFTIRE